MDAIDQQIVALLRENARRSFQDIGKRVSLSAPAVKRRVDRLERDGVIRGYSATLDPAAFGWNTHAFVELFCEGRMSGAEVRDAVAEHPEVEGAYTIAGAPSAIIHVRAADTQHLELALERIRETPGVLRTQTQVVLSTLFERPVLNGRHRYPDPAGADAGAREGSRGGAAAIDRGRERSSRRE
jgi:DNA-binding Lrp family transcriptional regulator